MATVTLKGTPFEVSGSLPEINSPAPVFCLTGKDLNQIQSADFSGKQIVLNIFPSIDTSVCALSVKKFNQEAAGRENAVILCVSADLPFAQSRFCAAEGVDHVLTASVFRSPDFAADYGVGIVSGPLAGLLTRAVIIVDGCGKVVYSELVPEIAQEPDYPAALAMLGN